MEGLKKSFFTVRVFARLNTKRFFRDRLALFFGIAFPLIFLFVFGGIFGHDSGVTFRIALINQSNSSYAKNFVDEANKSKIFKINQDIKTLEEAQEKMTRSQIDATIILPPDFGTVKDNQPYPSGQAQVYYTPNDEQAAQTLISVLQTQFNEINKKFVKVEVPFTVAAHRTNQNSLSQFDYTFAGLLGFSIIGLGIFGPINVFPELKKQGILRRLSTTPLKVWQYFTSTAISQVIIGLMTIAIMFVVAILVFNLKVVGNYAALALFITLSIVTILGIGLALGGWAKNERQVAPLANIIVFPMLFLSGTFFPRFLMPEWLQNISSFLPLTPVIDGIRLIATEGKTLLEVGPQIGLLTIWCVVIYFIAFRVFRWE